MMEIDDAIKHCEEVAERQERASGFWSKGSTNYKNSRNESSTGMVECTI